MAQSTKWLLEECLQYSEDGYIRLTFQQLCTLRFSQRQTIDDDELREELVEQDVPAIGAGYCDWLDVSTAVQISVGWAWFVTAHDAPQLLAPGGLSSNVMITAADGSDLGPSKTDELLRAWLSGQAWQNNGPFAGLAANESNTILVH